MSVRPIDVQISIQRSSEYTKEASLQNQKPSIDQLINTREFQYQVEHAQHKVVSAGHTYYKRIDKDPNEKRQSRQDNAERDNTGGENEGQLTRDGNNKTKKDENIKGVNIDIKI